MPSASCSSDDSVLLYCGEGEVGEEEVRREGDREKSGRREEEVKRVFHHKMQKGHDTLYA